MDFTTAIEGARKGVESARAAQAIARSVNGPYRDSLVKECEIALLTAISFARDALAIMRRDAS